MNSKAWPFHVKIMGHDPESRGASLTMREREAGWFGSF